MSRSLFIFAIFLFLTINVEGIYRVRKYIHPKDSANPQRRSAEDDLDEQAADTIFSDSEGDVVEQPADGSSDIISPTSSDEFPTPHGAPGFQPSEASSTQNEPVQSSMIAPSEPSWVIPLAPNAFDANINPDMPTSPPFARGLYGIPDGWNLDKQIDEDFRRGYYVNNMINRRRF